MGNISFIHHQGFDSLYELTKNYNKAILLDKLVYWWQISKYKLNDEKIWFTRSIHQISADAKIAKRSVERYLQSFEKDGFIIKTNKLYKKKNLYISITDKLLALIAKEPKRSESKVLDTAKESIFLKQNGVTDPAKMAESIYKDQDYKTTNNIVNSQTTVNDFAIEPQLQNCLSTPLKNYIKGMLFNVQKQDHLKISDPNKLFAEVVFSVIQENQWNGIHDPKHRVNIIAKLLREKQWRTPKGFYNHWSIGHQFRQKEQEKFKSFQNQKKQETGVQSMGFEKRFHDEYRYAKPKPFEKDLELHKLNSSLQELSLNIRSEEAYFKQLQLWFKEQNKAVSQPLIDSVVMKIRTLYEEKQKIVEQLKGTGLG